MIYVVQKISRADLLIHIFMPTLLTKRINDANVDTIIYNIICYKQNITTVKYIIDQITCDACVHPEILKKVNMNSSMKYNKYSPLVKNRHGTNACNGLLWHLYIPVASKTNCITIT